MNPEKFMRLAIEEARQGMRAGEGGPFGAVVVLGGQVIGRGHNQVLAHHDPTAHAEVQAIRQACSHLGSHHLSGAAIYSNFEPCPMCLSAIYWSDLREVYFCADRLVAEDAGFMDRKLYEQFELSPQQREVKSARVEVEEMASLLAEWKTKDDKILY
jgi:guanine deaminase